MELDQQPCSNPHLISCNKFHRRRWWSPLMSGPFQTDVEHQFIAVPFTLYTGTNLFPSQPVDAIDLHPPRPILLNIYYKPATTATGASLVGGSLTWTRRDSGWPAAVVAALGPFERPSRLPVSAASSDYLDRECTAIRSQCR